MLYRGSRGRQGPAGDGPRVGRPLQARSRGGAWSRAGGGLGFAFVLALQGITGSSALSAQEIRESTPGETRRITLAEARAEAAKHSPDVAAAHARAEAARQGARAAASFLWPSLGAEAGAVRSDDPVAAFGGRLRQGRFTQADFDPGLLNNPDPLTDWSAAVGAEWTPVDLSADLGRRAAVKEAEAAGLVARWARRAAEFRAEVRYMEAVGAAARLRAARAAFEAAQANAEVARRRWEEGTLTRADVLQAQAMLEDARTRVIDAERGVTDARETLSVALGWPADLIPVPVDTLDLPTLAEAQGPAREVAAVDERPDLMASARGVEAARTRAGQIRAARLPKIGGFARLSTHAADPFQDTRRNWTVGFQVKLPVFTGFALAARERAASALWTAAERDHEGRVRQARAQASGARRALEAARQGAVAADAAAAAAEEAARLMRRRFEEGLTTPADLLSAEARAAQLRAAAVNSRLRVHIARARLALLTGSSGEAN